MTRAARTPRSLRRWLPVALMVASASVALRADAYDPVLHEFVPPDKDEDLALAVTTADGELPAAIKTPAGVVPAPDTQRAPTSTEKAYGGVSTPASADATYRPDRNTNRPDLVAYDEDFTPSIAPYKRFLAFDAVGADYVLRVHDAALAHLALGGVAGDDEDSFYGDFTVDLEPNATVRVPSVGAGSHVLRMHTTPEVPLELLRDGADNWYARSPQKGRTHLVMQVAISRSAFGFDFGMPAWSDLRGAAVLPHFAQRAAARVAQAIGVSRSQPPREVLTRLVSYFRAFEPSADPPTGHDDVYLDLALSQKGVCRHRAFAFLVTALGLGIPSRMVTNEAHAWVEVSDGQRWHRIDLGGAAGAIEETSLEGRPPYQSPPDPFAWPGSNESSGEETAARARASSSPGNGSGAGTTGSGNGSSPESTTASSGSTTTAAGASSAAAAAARTPESPTEDPGRAPHSPDEESLPAAHIVVAGAGPKGAEGELEAHRGAPMPVSGTVDADGAPCVHLRVDVVLRSPLSQDGRTVGSLATDESGRYHGSVSLPLDLAVGDYELQVMTAGDQRCGPGRSPLP